LGRYDGIIGDAKVAITDVAMRSIHNTGSNLKVRSYVEELRQQLRALEQDHHKSVFDRLKDAMFDTSEDAVKERASRQAVNLTYQLNCCLRCRCITCAMIEDSCRCEGCLFGSHVTTCDGGGGVETRQVESGVCLVDGMPVVRAEFDRQSRKTTVTMLDRNDVERRFALDLATGKKSPVQAGTAGTRIRPGA
jgi:hypothetical protein